MLDPLIYGKNQLEKVTSIEVNDNLITLYREGEEPEFLSNKFWILSNKQLNKKFVRLKGDLHYKYGLQFNTRSEYLKMRSIWRNGDTYSIYDPKEAAMVKDGITSFKGLKHTDLSVLSFDIETTSLNLDDTAKILLISNTFRDRHGNVQRKLFCFDEYEDAGEMLKDWCLWVNACNPSVIIGHNIYSYDLPYMQYIADRHNVTLDLGRDKSAITFDKNDSKFRKDASQFLYYKKPRIHGREIIDTMFLSIKYDIGRKFPNYRLKDIIKFLKKEVPGRQFYDADQIRHRYTDPEEWIKIKKYAEHDADDSLTLYDIMIPPFFYLAQSVPKPFQAIIESASGSQINAMMVRSYLQEAHSLPQASEAERYEGAISFGNPGIWRNAFKIDVASLYPSIMIHYGVYNKQKDPNGNMLKMVKIFTAERLKNKDLAETTGDKFFDHLQSAQKICVNSMYGFLGATGLLFNSPKDAAFVTEKGREILQQSVLWAIGSNLIKLPKKKEGEFEWAIGPNIQDSKGFSLVNCDTDSIMFCKPDFAEIRDDERKELLDEVNALFPERIKFTDDGYYDTAIIFKAKNYALWGYNKKEGKMVLATKGSALKDAKKPKALKEFCDKIIQAIIDKRTDYVDIYYSYVREIYNITDITRWAAKKTITEKVMNASRTNEQKILDAIEDSEYVEGDKCLVFFKEDGSLCLAENYDGNCNREKLLDSLYKSTLLFESVLDASGTFINFKLKRSKAALEWVINGESSSTNSQESNLHLQVE